MKKTLVILLLLSMPVALCPAQSLQTIQPGDSLEQRRIKENSNFGLLNTKITSAVSNSHAHVNKPLLDTIPSLFGTQYQFLRLNAAGAGFEFATIAAGTGINISNAAGTLTVSLQAGNGITSLNGLTGATQTFTNDTNITVTSSGTAHALGWTGFLAGTRGGTNNGFFQVSGPASTLKTFTFPNQSANVLTDAAAVTVAQGGTGATTLAGLLKGNGTSAVTALTTSAGIFGAISDETGSGALVGGTAPTLSDPLFSGTGRFTAGAESR